MAIKHRRSVAALILLWTATSHAQPFPEPPKGAGALPELPPDRAVLEIEIPAGATAKFDGVALGAKRVVEIAGLKPGVLVAKDLNIAFPDGSLQAQTIMVRGGWRIRKAFEPVGRTKPELIAQTGHADAISCMAISPGGQWLLTGSFDGKAILWDIATGRQLRTYNEAATEVTGVAFHPDGKKIVVGHVDGTAIENDVETGAWKAIRLPAGSGIHSVAYTPDGAKLLFGFFKGGPNGNPNALPIRQMLVLWPSANGVAIFDAATHKTLATVNADFRILAPPTVSDRFTTVGARAETWDIATGRSLGVVATGGAGGLALTYAALSPDGKRLLTGYNYNKTIYLTDMATGKSRDIYTVGKSDGAALAFHPTENRALIAGLQSGAELTLVDLTNGNELQNWQLYGGQAGMKPLSAAFTRDGKSILTVEGDSGNQVGMYDAATGERIRTFKGVIRPVVALSASKTGDRVAALSEYNSTAIWDVTNGGQVIALGTPRPQKGMSQLLQMNDVALSPDGQSVAVASKKVGPTQLVGAEITDLVTGRVVHSLPAATLWFRGIAYSADGRQLATTAEGTDAVTVWNAATGRRMRSLKQDFGSATPSFSPDGKTLLTAGRNPVPYDGVVRPYSAAVIWDLETGQEKRKFTQPSASPAQPGANVMIDAVAWDADGKRILTASRASLFQIPGPKEMAEERQCYLWDAGSGALLQTFAGHRGAVHAAAFVGNNHVLTASADGSVRLWNVSTGKLVRAFGGHTDKVNAVVVLADGRRIATGSSDGTMRIWDIATGDELVRFYNLDDGAEWLAVSPDAFFDGSARGREMVAFRLGQGLRTASMDQFFKDFFRPGFLRGSAAGDLPAVQIVAANPPSVRIVPPAIRGDDNLVEVNVEATHEPGQSIPEVELFQNGSRIQPEGTPTRSGKKTLLAFPAMLIEGENVFEARVSTGKGAPEVYSTKLTLKFAKPLDKPRLHVIAVGVNDYAESSFKLKYASSDASAMADLFRRRGEALYQTPRILTLTDALATRQAIRKAIADLSKGPLRAKPQDTVVLFFAGHGTMVGSRYYFIPPEFKPSKKTREEDVAEQGLPGDEIAELLSQTPALKRVLILDTCQAAGALSTLGGGRNPEALREAVERLNQSTGVFTIAAAAVGSEAKEVGELQHGVLTYALLAGLNAVKVDSRRDAPIQKPTGGRIVNVSEWFVYAENKVPELMQKYYGRKQYVQNSNRGATFPLLPLDDK